MRIRAVVLALVASGCGRIGFDPRDAQVDAPFEDPPAFTAGTRLRPNVVVGEDGSVFLSNWYDTLLQTDCVFSTFGGQLGCFPTATALASYADAACTQPYVGITPSCLRASATVQATLGPGVPTKLYRLGPAETLPMSYSLSSGSCALQTGSTVMLSPLIEELPPSAFALAQERRVPHGRLANYVYTTDDGAAQKATKLYDTLRGEDCTWYAFGDADHARCLPAAIQLFGRYADPGCTAAAEVSGARPSVFVGSSDIACGFRDAVYDVGAQLPTTYGFNGSNQCVEFGVPAGSLAFAVGPQISLDELAAATRVVPATTPRIQIAKWQGPDGISTDGTVWDTAHDAPCLLEPVGGASNLVSCAPVPTTGLFTFSDAGCTMPVGQAVAQCDRPWVASLNNSAATPTCAGFPYDIYLYDQPFGGALYIQPTCKTYDTGSHPVFVSSSTALDPSTLVSFGFATQ